MKFYLIIGILISDVFSSCELCEWFLDDCLSIYVYSADRGAGRKVYISNNLL